MSTENPPLIVHVIHQLGVGGLENGLVNLINQMPVGRYRHSIICLKGYTDFRQRITRNDVEVFALNKQEGYDFKIYYHLFKIIRQLKPDIVHTRNLATIEAQLIAVAAQVKARIHGEHGRDVFDLKGENRKYNLFRKLIYPFVNHFIAVSKDLEDWLMNILGVSSSHISQIYNGVDSRRFCPSYSKYYDIGPEGFFSENTFVIGSVGRMVAVKDYPSLVRAFLLILKEVPGARENLRLLIVGEGDSRNECLDLLRDAGAENLAWLPGERTDIPELMCAMDLFVLPSLGEGISNTILEAMSSRLPVIATRVGGNVELVNEGVTGELVTPGNVTEIASAIMKYYKCFELRDSHGAAARQYILENFSMETMLKNYLGVYDRVLQH